MRHHMSTESQMPMGKAAAAASTPPLPPLPMPPKGNVPMPLPMPPISTTPAAGPVGAPPAGAPLGMPPAPGAQPMPQVGQPQQPPYSVKLQPNGSSLYYVPSPDGNPANDIVLGLNDPPKVPKAFQKPAPPQ